MPRYRIAVCGEPRAPWRDTPALALPDAIRLQLASYEEERGGHFLAVPVEVEREGGVC